MTSLGRAAGIRNRDADIAARQEPRPVGGALAGGEVGRRIELGGVDGREALGQPAAQQQRNRRAQPFSFGDGRSILVARDRPTERLVDAGDEPLELRGRGARCEEALGARELDHAPEPEPELGVDRRIGIALRHRAHVREAWPDRDHRRRGEEERQILTSLDGVEQGLRTAEHVRELRVQPCRRGVTRRAHTSRALEIRALERMAGIRTEQGDRLAD